MFAATRPLPALIAGNTLVIKPAPQTSLSTLGLAELFAEAFPAGVVNIVSGGAGAGDALVTHPEVKRIAFTGSVATGLKIQERGAQSGHVKHLSLELGGKNAMVVFPDVDVDEAVEGAVYGMNFNVCQGQSCGSNSRVLVHRRVYDDFVAKAAEQLRDYTRRRGVHRGGRHGPAGERAALRARERVRRVRRRRRRHARDRRRPARGNSGGRLLHEPGAVRRRAAVDGDRLARRSSDR